ncbi:sensor histidine kinase regulating citrate/malate metabolism [Murinocardiopsis flavida]|uniref:histidine kinase n=1 Tax=Murinocardiopsis flavida TaxID=645275 RepID=A0A2P8DRT4_9ACTN|nr:sensor histidine kinase [Murinocardiopsis flavida]PSK99925.1 sensor histidine kinase regulating citrate/malate metabolism [Murinocardiopsis flavida]
MVPPWHHWPLATQFLGFQLAIMVVVLAAVAALSIQQAQRRFEDAEGRRLQSIAESMAALPAVRYALDRRLVSPLSSTAANTRDVSGLTQISVADEGGLILTSHDPDDLGRRMPMGTSTALTGRSWIGHSVSEPWEPGEYRPALSAHVPVFNDLGEQVGIIAVREDYPYWWVNLDAVAPYLLGYLGIAGGLGAIGSLLLARRVKRQTMGMEPRQIAATVQQREAMLHGVKEGVLGLDLDNRVTLANRQAVALLGLPPDCLGRRLADLGLDAPLHDVLAGGGEGEEQVVLLPDRVLTLNRMPMTTGGARIGSVATLRDRTELVQLRRELDVTRHTTDALRAQTHEFDNRMHTISGLIALREFDEAATYIARTVVARERLSGEITGAVADHALAALFIAKAATAAERGVAFVVHPETRIGEIDPELSVDLVTIAGNLIDNAFDALRPGGGGTVTVRAEHDADDVVLSVGDDGPGVSEDLAGAIFQLGFSTKAAPGADPRGLGLAIVRLICRRRNGSVAVRSSGGALFTARLPAAGPAAREAGADLEAREAADR